MEAGERNPDVQCIAQLGGGILNNMARDFDRFQNMVLKDELPGLKPFMVSVEMMDDDSPGCTKVIEHPIMLPHELLGALHRTSAEVFKKTVLGPRGFAGVSVLLGQP